MRYILCSRPRSGSTLLANVLGNCLGEWFHPSVDMPAFCTLYGCYGATAADRAAVAWRQADGFTLHHDQPYHNQLRDLDFKVVWLERRNEVERLLSLLTALALDRWQYQPGQPPLPADWQPKPVDLETLPGLVRYHAEASAAAKRAFADKESMTVQFEDVVRGRLATVQAFTGSAGLRAARTAPSPKPAAVLANYAAVVQVLQKEVKAWNATAS